MRKTLTVPVELYVANGEQVLLIYRDDHEYRGWHMPGTVIRDNESVDGAITRLLDSEVQAVVSKPESLGWTEVPRELNGVRHEISLLHFCRLQGPYTGPGRFFFANRLPADTLRHHKILIPMMRMRENDLMRA
jgi:ADP-ribose pyrophosphatase YjhB (NUDIX family)